jgi:hypothetical protein
MLCFAISADTLVRIIYRNGEVRPIWRIVKIV